MREWIIALILLAGSYAISWALTVFIVKLITMCFSWDFSLAAATGVWLILCLVGDLFHKSGEGK